jgi:hypothetical protein
MTYKFINAPYYNLANNTLLKAKNIKRFIKYILENIKYYNGVFNPKAFCINACDFLIPDPYNLRPYIRRLKLPKADYATLYRAVKNNSYNIRNILIEKINAIYMWDYIIEPVARVIAINKIKRNRLYNLGLGLKLAIKEYSKEF